jgi:sialic acid synthase SpsE/sugar phosphate isomerase/epimerase
MKIKINNFTIGEEKTFIIAEIGNNHNGNIEIAKKLILKAINAGADCVKFQIRNREALYRKPPGEHGSEDLGVEYIQDLLNKVELNISQHKEIFNFCKLNNITYMCTPWDEPSVEILKDFGVQAIKLASADLTNPYLIKKAAALKIPLILSTGMSYENEIIQAKKLLVTLNSEFVFLHCNSAYPAPIQDIQLSYLIKLKQIHPLVGYSGHERGIAISIAAVALGAKVIERHITLDRNMEGPDHAASLEPDEFKMLVDGIREVETAIPCKGNQRFVSQGELLNRENLSKSVISNQDINLGQTFDDAMFIIASPGQGLSPYRLPELIGKKSNRNIRKGDFLIENDLLVYNKNLRRKYNFTNYWGVPIRYHDFNQYKENLDPDLFEFHLSFKDLYLNPKKYLSEVNCKRLIVHAPELFENSELLDICSNDIKYRKKSIENLKRIVNITQELSIFFPKADSALIVANVGGFSMDKAIEFKYREELYNQFYDSFKMIDFGKTELIPQNMAPFPWHFGGQRHQNIFMMPDELTRIAKISKLRYCLDLSHLQMTCTHFGIDFIESLEELLPFTAHLHIADAAGVNGEGVLIGTGDVNWEETWKIVTKYPNVSFIPEVWQGHKNQGNGFREALTFLEKLNK